MTDEEIRARLKFEDEERAKRIAKARAEGCPPGWEAEWETSGKFRMMVRERSG